MLFAYPPKSAYGRMLPKKKIYNNADIRKKMKDLFVEHVGKIIWSHKLAPETINIRRTRNVPEIQIISLPLKRKDLNADVLRCIDKIIPFPVIFELKCNGRIKVMACYKRPSESDPKKWVVGEYFETDWMKEETPRERLPTALNLESLYRHILLSITPYPALDDESMADYSERVEKIRLKEREISRAESRMKREKQYNRKIEINREIRSMKLELGRLIGVESRVKATDSGKSHGQDETA